MVGQSVYDALIRKRDEAEEEYNQTLKRIEEYEYLLNRLEKAKVAISGLKDDFSDLKEAHKNLAKKDHKWKGKTYTAFDNKMDSITDNNDYYYNYQLDRILDALNNEITRIENLKLQEFGLLGKLGAVFNDACNKIENFLN